MFVSIINDCKDPNAMNRQSSRFIAYFNSAVSILGLSDFGDNGNGEIEAAGNLVDTLDAIEGRKGIIAVNVAVRHGEGKKWPNGSPFGYFYYKDTLVISTIDGYVLSLVKKLEIVRSISVLDVPAVMGDMIKRGLHSKEYRSLVEDSQFRSYEFVPRAAKWLEDGIELPKEDYSIDKVPDAPRSIWWVDNFGNSVSTVLPEEIGHEPGKIITTKYGDIKCYDRMKDVPDNEVGLIIGSSGINDKRFIELIIQGKSAAKHFNLISGSPLF